MNVRKITDKSLAMVLIGGLSLSCSIPAFDHSHRMWTKILQKTVKNGRVNYKHLKNDAAAFNMYLNQLSAVEAEELSHWSKEQKLAYWINAYNAYTIKAIIDNYPVKSIKKIPGVWKKLKFKAGGEDITLDEIEHKKLRAELKDPRIHFAVNCASIGCPVISDQAYSADKLDAQFGASVKAMLTNAGQFRIDRDKEKIYLSKILDWFRDDFQDFKEVHSYGKNNGPISFLLEYLPKTDQNYIRTKKLSVKWLDYDWTLNEGS